MLVIFVPYYNYSERLIGCLESIISQTNKNFKVILFDDGSEKEHQLRLREWLFSSHSGKVLKKDVFKYIYIHNKENKGVGFSKYYGLKYIENNFDDEDIVCIIDGDDKLLRNDVFDNIQKLYNSDNKILWTLGGYDAHEEYTEDFQYQFFGKIKFEVRTLEIPHMRTFKKKFLGEMIFNNFHMPGYSFVIKNSDKIMMWPIMRKYAEYGVLIKQKFYEYYQTNGSLSHVKAIKRKDEEKFEMMLKCRHHFFKNMIICWQEELSEKRLLRRLQNKKIIVVGNRPLDKDFSKIVDSYDVVVRFNFSFIGNQDPKSGQKLSYLFINNGLTKHLLGRKYSKLREFVGDAVAGFNKWADNNKNRMITRYSYVNQEEFNMLNNTFFLINGLHDVSENDKLLFFLILDQFKLKFDRIKIQENIKENKHFSLGLVFINWLIFNNFKPDIIGFSKKADVNYHITYEKLRRNKTSEVDMSKINNHVIDLEYQIRDFYKKNNLINIIDE